MLDWVPKFWFWTTSVPGTALLGTNDDSVLTGTGISWPEAMIAFLLLLVKTIGREITLNFPVESSAFTRAVRPFPRLRKILVPPPPTRLVVNFVISVSVSGSTI